MNPHPSEIVKYLDITDFKMFRLGCRYLYTQTLTIFFDRYFWNHPTYPEYLHSYIKNIVIFDNTVPSFLLQKSSIMLYCHSQPVNIDIDVIIQVTVYGNNKFLSGNIKCNYFTYLNIPHKLHIDINLINPRKQITYVHSSYLTKIYILMNKNVIEKLIIGSIIVRTISFHEASLILTKISTDVSGSNRILLYDNNKSVIFHPDICQWFFL